LISYTKKIGKNWKKIYIKMEKIGKNWENGEFISLFGLTFPQLRSMTRAAPVLFIVSALVVVAIQGEEGSEEV